MENKLYKEFAPYYAAMSNHRNFTGQLDFILGSYPSDSPCRSLLELFAGQSLHSIAALKKGYIDVWAIDGSIEMKALAISNGFKNPDQYIVGDLPEAILKANRIKFDCVTCLYHGLSNLTPQKLYEALSNIKKVLNPSGKVFLEIHNIYMIMGYLGSPAIHYEEIQSFPGETVKYAWPSGPIKWNPLNFNAEVPIKLFIQSSKGTETIEFISEDRIYSAEEITFIGELHGYHTKVLNYEVPGRVNFGNSVVLELSLK